MPQVAFNAETGRGEIVREWLLIYNLRKQQNKQGKTSNHHHYDHQPGISKS